MRTQLTGAFLLLAIAFSSPVFAGGRDVTKAQDLMEQGLYDEALAYIQESLRKKQDFTSMQELRGLMERAQFGKAESEGSIASYEAYLERGSSGPNANLAHQRICEIAFADANAEATRDGSPGPLVAFLEERGGCREQPEATARAVELAIVVARADGSSAAFREAIALFPVECAAAGLVEDEDHAAYREAVAAATLPAYTGYLDGHPAGLHADEVRAKAEGFAWQDVLSDNSEAAVVEFLERFPGGVHAADAAALRKDRVRGLRRIDGDQWSPIEDTPWAGPGTLIYKPGENRPSSELRLQVVGLHSLPTGGEAVSPITYPLSPWIEARLGVPAGSLDAPSVVGTGPGEHGEVIFEVPFELRSWRYRGAIVQRYQLRIIDGSGGPALASVEVGAAEGQPRDFGALVRASGKELFSQDHALGGEGPYDLLRQSAVAVSLGEYVSAATLFSRARMAWPGLPSRAPATEPGEHGGLLLVAYGDPARAPGSAGSAFLPLAMSAAGQLGPVRTVEAGLDGVVLLSGGKKVGSFSTKGSQGMLCGRPGAQGTLSVYSGISPQALFGRYLYLLHPSSRVADVTVPSSWFIERWPSLGVTMGGTSEDWLRLQLQSTGTQPAAVDEGNRVVITDLDVDGLPDFLRSKGGNLVLVSLSAAGEVDVRPTGMTGSPELIADLDGDGVRELVVHQNSGDSDLFHVGQLDGGRIERKVTIASSCRSSE